MKSLHVEVHLQGSAAYRLDAQICLPAHQLSKHGLCKLNMYNRLCLLLAQP